MFSHLNNKSSIIQNFSCTANFLLLSYLGQNECIIMLGNGLDNDLI